MATVALGFYRSGESCRRLLYLPHHVGPLPQTVRQIKLQSDQVSTNTVPLTYRQLSGDGSGAGVGSGFGAGSGFGFGAGSGLNC